MLAVSVCVVGAAGLLCGWAAKNAFPSGPSKPLEPSLVVAGERLQFGEVWENPAFRWVVPIENRSDRTIVIERFDASCTCLGVTPAALEIPPQEQREVTMTIDLARESAIAKSGSVTLSLTPILAGYGGGPKWTITGQVKIAFNLNARFFNLGQHSDRSASISKWYGCEPLAPLAKLQARSTSTLFTTAVVKSGSGYEVTVAAAQPLRQGAHKGEILVHAEMADGSTTPALTVPVTVSIVCDVQPNQSTLIFASPEAGQVAEEIVTLNSLTGRPFEVVRVRTEGPVACQRRRDQPGSSYLVRSLAEGDKTTGTGAVIWTIRPDEGSEYDTRVDVTGFGRGVVR